LIRYPDSIEIVEVAPPDGLQSFSLRLDDAEEVIAGIRRQPACRYRALMPNRRGGERAIAWGGLDELLGLMTISSEYSRRNQNMTVDEAITQGLACHRSADAAGLFFTMAVDMAMCVRSKG
jgi:hydroxymethylglutaryl-CoA lyase